MKKIRIMLDHGDGTTVTLGSIESEGRPAMHRCHPRMLADKPVREPVSDALGRWAPRPMSDVEEP